MGGQRRAGPLHRRPARRVPVGPEQADDQQRVRVHQVSDRQQQVERRLVGPVQVVEHQHQSGGTGDEFELRSDGPVEPGQDVGVPLEVGLRLRPEPGGDHRGDVAVPVDPVLKGQHLLRVDLVPSAEGGLADPGPELALGDGHAAAAELAFDEAALPDEDDLAGRAEAGQLAEDALDERGAAAAEASDVEDLLRL